MPTETQQRTHCPACGAKLAQAGLSMCSYCLTPLQLDGGPKEAQSATGRRLAKMREHKDFERAMAWDPPLGPSSDEGKRLRARALICFVSGLATFAVAALWITVSSARWVAPGPLATALLGLTGAAWLLAALFHSLRGRALAKLRAAPLLRRPALVKDRRSETAVPGSHTLTVYYFTLEFEDGSSADFRFPGRGGHHEPLVQGNTGVAYTREQHLVDFLPIRV